MTEQPYMTTEEVQRLIDGRIAADRALQAPPASAPRHGIVRRVWGLVGSLLWLALILSVITVFLFVARVQYGLPIPLPASLVGTAAVTFSTAAAPLATPVPFGGAAQPFAQPPTASGTAPWPTLTPTAQPTLTIPPEPYTTKANLGPSSPESNPGFTCGVEPGMPVDATCAETKPELSADPEEAPDVVDIYSVEDRVFRPAVLPTSSVKDNPGFDSSVEPGGEPTPAQ